MPKISTASILPIAAFSTVGIKWVSGSFLSPISPDEELPAALKYRRPIHEIPFAVSKSLSILSMWSLVAPYGLIGDVLHPLSMGGVTGIPCTAHVLDTSIELTFSWRIASRRLNVPPTLFEKYFPGLVTDSPRQERASKRITPSGFTVLKQSLSSCVFLISP